MRFSQEDKLAALEKMRAQFNADKAGDLDAVIQIDLSGEDGGVYWVKVADRAVDVGSGETENPRMTLIATPGDFLNLVNGELNAMQAFMSGKLKVKGDMGLAMKLQSIFGL